MLQLIADVAGEPHKYGIGLIGGIAIGIIINHIWNRRRRP